MAAVSGKRASAADVNAIVNSSSGKPLVRLVQQVLQTLASDTDSPILFATGSEEIDTAGWHDVATNTSRITPTVAGYIRLTGTVWYAADTDITNYYASIGKNGAAVQRNRIVLPSTALPASVTRSAFVTCTQQCNGSTDYFELWGRQLQATPGTLNTQTGAGIASTFEAEYLRPL
jgi:hypothetical protein